MTSGVVRGDAPGLEVAPGGSGPGLGQAGRASGERTLGRPDRACGPGKTSGWTGRATGYDPAAARDRTAECDRASGPGRLQGGAGNTGEQGSTPHPTIVPSVAHRARVHDYWLGGRDHFAADRVAGDQAATVFPGLVESVRATRGFLARTVRFLAAEAGVTQFLDIGAGLPTAGNTHEVAQSVAPEAQVVYLDTDPVVFAHGRALLASGPHGNTSYLRADLRDPEQIVTEAARMLDLTRPLAVMLVSVLEFVPDEADPGQLAAAVLDAMPPGSYLVAAHPGGDLGAAPEASLAGGHTAADPTVTVRSRAEVSRFFAGLRLLEPGLVPLPAWRPDAAPGAGAPCTLWGAVGVK